jgi:ceramide glucosyltransferase
MSEPAWGALPIWEWAILLPVVAGTLYWFACLGAMARLKVRMRRLAARMAAAGPGAPAPPAATAAGGERMGGEGAAGGEGASAAAAWPPVSVLRPVYGLTKELEACLRSVCRLDYPNYQVVLSAQRDDEPALPLMRQVQREMPPGRVDVVVDGSGRTPNGKVRNLLVGLSGARHDVLVVSDSDVPLQPDYLKAIVAPLLDPAVGCATTFYKAAGAGPWYEALEQLFINTEWVPNLAFAHVTGASPFVLGASNAVRRSTLDAIGGLADLGNYLLEDFEMGRRLRAAGKRIAVVPYFVETLVDLPNLRAWWRHQVYWDRNTRAGNAWGLFGTLFIRPIPWALLLAALRPTDPLTLAVAAAAVALRLLSAGLFLGWGLGDRRGLRSLALVPLRDLAGFAATVLVLARPPVVWTGAWFRVGPGGRMLPVAGKRPA